MISKLRGFLLGLAILTVPALASIEIYEFDTVEQEQLFKELGHTLRCPKCQNNSIGDSNAVLAQDLRQKVYEMLKKGKSEQEIIDYMIARYGNFVTYNPPITAATSILWLGPVAVLVIGFGLIVVRSRGKQKVVEKVTDEEWDADKEAQLQALLKEDDNNGDAKK
ncbi:cystathionine gamma-synthase [Vibrio nigripulchritudo]|uniref:cytochrome c-type biogenesis protein n=1 Tax=Vibrio nigripulchritudo TaxID=28173 RepID=UPI00190C7DBB|nr:cytochrome c-type biogenesis protein [Vibrio nigripulchritudo]BCL70674.1 cystathionine gamma-synthase [Vibrio nigripulchritudo]BDU32029.1 cystathionine gamma-synthase [Vibrio nigripulchritudo]